MLYFSYPLSGNTTIKITDITGRLMEQQILHDMANATFNVANYTPGIYLYQVITNGNTQSGKILIGN